MKPIPGSMVSSHGPLPRVAFVATLIAAFFLITVRGPLSQPTWVSPITAFWLIVIITALCAIGAVFVAAIGWRRRLAELTILGSCLFAVSVLPLVHGLTIPGVLYAENSATAAPVFVAVPLGVLIAAPLVAPKLRVSRAVALRWRLWTSATILASIGLAAALLVDPELLPRSRISSGESMAVTTWATPCDHSQAGSSMRSRHSSGAPWR